MEKEFWLTIMLLTAVIAVACLILAIRSLVRFLKSRNKILLIRTSLLMLGFAASALLNPFVNMFVFMDVHNNRVARMIAEMHSRSIEGKGINELRQKYGEPELKRHKDNLEYWFYDPNPWYVSGWDRVGVTVEHGIVTQIWTDG